LIVADDFEDIIKSFYWALIVSFRVGFNDISFKEKENYKWHLLEIPVEDNNLRFPTGLF
jgi:hypothetical protein